MKVVVSIPTYNEHKNTEPLIMALHQQFASMGHAMNTLVVDGNSPDGVSDNVRAQAGKFPK